MEKSMINRTNWEERFDERLKIFYTKDFIEKVNFDPIKSFIRQEIEAQ